MGKLLREVVSNDILKLGASHKGYRHERMKWDDNDRERAFYQHWRKENKHRSWINFGQGILQDLFAIPAKSGHWWKRIEGWNIVINKRDQYIVATVIQWLGTNCGWCFLNEVLNKCGYEIVKTDKQREKEKQESERKYREHLSRIKLK